MKTSFTIMAALLAVSTLVGCKSEEQKLAEMTPEQRAAAELDKQIAERNEEIKRWVDGHVKSNWEYSQDKHGQGSACTNGLFGTMMCHSEETTQWQDQTNLIANNFDREAIAANGNKVKVTIFLSGGQTQEHVIKVKFSKNWDYKEGAYNHLIIRTRENNKLEGAYRNRVSGMVWEIPQTGPFGGADAKMYFAAENLHTWNAF